MDNLLGEHGEALVYAIIGVIVVIVICYVCENKWKDITPEYKTAISKNNSSFINSNKYNYPVIEADETIYVEYETNNFSCIDFIKATDCNGKDITDKVKIYGKVDTNRKGIYKLRCQVIDDSQLACTKYINVIVE